ncbi:MAG: hypothetical protein SGPRY_009873, partial [Prymnesium sp.]
MGRGGHLLLRLASCRDLVHIERGDDGRLDGRVGDARGDQTARAEGGGDVAGPGRVGELSLELDCEGGLLGLGVLLLQLRQVRLVRLHLFAEGADHLVGSLQLVPARVWKVAGEGRGEDVRGAGGGIGGKGGGGKLGSD